MAKRTPRPAKGVLGEGETAHGGDSEEKQRVGSGQEGAVYDVLDDRHFFEQPGEILERRILGQEGGRIGKDFAGRLERSGDHPEQRREDQQGEEDQEDVCQHSSKGKSHNTQFSLNTPKNRTWIIEITPMITASAQPIVAA